MPLASPSVAAKHIVTGENIKHDTVQAATYHSRKIAFTVIITCYYHSVCYKREHLPGVCHKHVGEYLPILDRPYQG